MTNIDTLVEITAVMADQKNPKYDRLADRFGGAELNVGQSVYNQSRDIKVLMEETKTIASHQSQPNFAAQRRWAVLSRQERADYAKLNTNSRAINRGLNSLAAACQKDPTFDDIFKRNHVLVEQQKVVLEAFLNGAKSKEIDAISLTIKDAFDAVDAAVEEGISQANKDAYFEARHNLYRVPNGAVGGLTDSQRNQMLIHNIAMRAKATLQRLQAVQQQSFLSSAASLFSLLTEMGELVGEFKRLDQQTLKEDAKEIINQHIKIVAEHAIELFHQSVIFAQESELRLDLRPGTLSQKLPQVSEKIQELIGMSNLQLTVAAPPYNKEKMAAMLRIRNEAAVRLRRLQEIKGIDVQRATENIIEIIAQLDTVSTYSAYEYKLHLQSVIDERIGMTKLENAIEALEADVITELKTPGIMSSNSLLTATSDKIGKLTFSTKSREKIKTLRELHVMRAELNHMVESLKSQADLTTSRQRPVQLQRFSKTEQRIIPEDRTTDSSGLQSTQALQRLAAVQTDIAELIKKEETVIAKMNENLVQLAGVEAAAPPLEESSQLFHSVSSFASSSSQAPDLFATARTAVFQTSLRTSVARRVVAPALSTAAPADDLFLSASARSEDLFSSAPARPEALFLSAASSLSTSARIVTEESVATALPVITALRNLSDHEVVEYVVDKAKGPIILQCDALRKKLIEMAKSKLTETEANKLDLKDENSFNIKEDDAALTAAIKSIYNLILKFEELILHVNKLQSIILHVNKLQSRLDSGYLGYAKIPAILPEIRRSIQNLTQQIKVTSATLQKLKKQVLTVPMHQEAFNPFSIFSGIMGQLASQLRLIGSNINFAADVELVQNIKQLLVDCVELQSDSAEFQAAAAKGTNEDLQQSTSLKTSVKSLQQGHRSMTGLIKLLKDKIAVITSNPDGTYDLNQFEEGSWQKRAATLVNAAYKMLAALDATERYAHGHPVTGLVELLGNLYSAWSLFKASDAQKFVQHASRDYSEAQILLQNMIDRQMLDVLKNIAPRINAVIAEAHTYEVKVGLKKNVLLAQIQPYLDQFKRLYESYHGVGDDKVVGLNSEVFCTAIDYQKASSQQEGSALDQYKIRILTAACIDHKHRYAEALHSKLEKAYPGSFKVNLNQPFQLPIPSLAGDEDSVLSITIKKFNKFLEMQETLQAPELSAPFKLSYIEKALRQNMPLFAKRRDTAWETFGKICATVFSLGTAVALGIWSTKGKEVAEGMLEITRMTAPRVGG